MLHPADETSPGRTDQGTPTRRAALLDEIHEQRALEVLHLMDEPAIGELADLPDAAAYRLLSMPSFEPYVGVRVERRGAGYHASVKVLDGPHRVSHTKLVFREERPVDFFEWRTIEALFADARFWRKPRHVDRMGLDGTTWVLEAARYGFYHAVIRWSPEPHGEDTGFLAACGYLLDLASPPGLWRRR